mmetsp:Transcript_92995/g.278959  ORF Transcript_92995/g.278959 Transcript_92995/m.278959 type:complete len:359 (+) Transcript_92995:1-1077(+)
MDGSASQQWSRNDVLLPLEDDLMADALRFATRKLQPVLTAAATCLPGGAIVGLDPVLVPGPVLGSESGPESRLESGRETGLELVEYAALIARVGAGHQMLHADYRRDCDFETIAALGGKALPDAEATNTASSAYDQMPPRLVTFVYLQDCPSAQHGATVFLPGTANDASHERHLGGGSARLPTPTKPTGLLRLTDHSDAAGGDGTADSSGQVEAAIATLRSGDAIVFDASCLHFGSAVGASSSTDEQRLVLYFGFAREGAAAVYDGGIKIRQATADDERRPLSLSKCCSGGGGGAGAAEAAADSSSLPNVKSDHVQCEVEVKEVEKVAAPKAEKTPGFGGDTSTKRSNSKAKKKKKKR